MRISGGEQPHEAHHLKLDCSKAKTGLDWHPCWDLRAGLQKTIEWYKAYRSNEDMLNFSMEQIKSYEEDLKTEREMNCRFCNAEVKRLLFLSGLLRWQIHISQRNSCIGWSPSIHWRVMYAVIVFLFNLMNLRVQKIFSVIMPIFLLTLIHG